MKMNLSKKVLVLVALPVVFQIAFVTILAGLLVDSNKIAKREANAKDVVACSNELGKSIYDMVILLSNFASAKDPTLINKFLSLKQGTESKLHDLKTKVIDDPAALDHAIKMDQTYLQFQSIMTDAIRSSSNAGSPGGFTASDDYRTAIKDLSNRFVVESEALTKTMKEVEKSAPEKAGQSNAVIMNWLAAGVIFNVLLAFVLAFLFNKGTTTRLNVLVENTNRLVDGKDLNPRLGGQDEVTRLDHVFHDMADRLAEAKRRELEIARLKQEFTAMVSHDLRTPLTSVSSLLEGLEGGIYGQLNETGTQRVAAGHRGVDRLIRLINELLDIEKMESGALELHKEIAGVQHIFDQASDAVRDFADEHKIALKVQSTDAEVICDSSRVIQVLVNLLSNAIKFSQPESEVVVSAKERDDGVSISVTDSGKGIPADRIGEVFERFRQVDSKRSEEKKGSGLGLSICKAIVEAHGGSISVESEVDKGTTFRFFIPNA